MPSGKKTSPQNILGNLAEKVSEPCPDQDDQVEFDVKPADADHSRCGFEGRSPLAEHTTRSPL